MSSTDLVRLLGPRHDFAAASDDKIRRMRRIDDLTLAGTTLDRYYHVCAFFDSRDEEYAVLAPFYREGIESGEKAVHIVDPALRRDHKRRLREAGIDVEHCESCGQLEVLSWEDAYVSGGTFDPEQMLAMIDDALTAGLRAGFPRVRAVGNMAWACTGRPASEKLIEYETRVNEVLARTRQPAVCVYDTANLSGTLLLDILRAHPLTLVNGVVHDNPFFTSPEQMLAEVRARSAWHQTAY